MLDAFHDSLLMKCENSLCSSKVLYVFEVPGLVMMLGDINFLGFVPLVLSRIEMPPDLRYCLVSIWLFFF